MIQYFILTLRSLSLSRLLISCRSSLIFLSYTPIIASYVFLNYFFVARVGNAMTLIPIIVIIFASTSRTFSKIIIRILLWSFLMTWQSLLLSWLRHLELFILLPILSFRNDDFVRSCCDSRHRDYIRYRWCY